MHSEEGAAVKAQLRRTDVIERKDRMMLLEVSDALRIHCAQEDREERAKRR